MRVALFKVDLLALGRLEPALVRLGMELGAPEEADIAVLDLDQLGPDGIRDVAPDLAGRGVRMIGYLSHVDATLAEAARAAGIEAYPRGRFFRDIQSILGRPADSGS